MYNVEEPDQNYKTTRPESALDTAQSELTEAVAGLEITIYELQDRLTPILQPARDNEKMLASSDREKGDASNSPSVIDLQMKTLRINRLRGQLANVMERLDA